MNSSIFYDKYRVKTGLFATQGSQNFGMFFIKTTTSKTPLKVMLAPTGGEWEHVSGIVTGKQIGRAHV